MKKHERIKLAREIRTNAIDETLLQMKSDNVIIEKTVTYLHNAMTNSIMSSLGCERGFGHHRICDGTPLKQKIDSVISSVLNTVQFEIPVLTDKEKETIQKLFNKHYKDALKIHAEKIAWTFAEDDINYIVGDDDAA